MPSPVHTFEIMNDLEVAAVLRCMLSVILAFILLVIACGVVLVM